eukprot:gene18913-biopygen21998
MVCMWGRIHRSSEYPPPRLPPPPSVCHARRPSRKGFSFVPCAHYCARASRALLHGTARGGVGLQAKVGASGMGREHLDSTGGGGCPLENQGVLTEYYFSWCGSGVSLQSTTFCRTRQTTGQGSQDMPAPRPRHARATHRKTGARSAPEFF